MNQQLPIKALLFDLDGVIINSLPVMRLALEAALREVYPRRELDFDAIFSEYQLHLGKGFKQIMGELNLSEATYEPFRKHSSYLAPYINLVPGIINVLNWCKHEKLIMGIATGKDFQRTRYLLTQHHIIGYFQDIFSADTVTHGKPAPEMAVRFMENNDLSPEQVIMIGDAEADIQCGNSAGCLTIYADWGYGTTQEEADIVLKRPEDLPGCINQINQTSSAVG